MVEDEAKSNAATFLELWTDTRFGAAHSLYERLGFSRSRTTRALVDLSNSVEFHYRKALP